MSGPKVDSVNYSALLQQIELNRKLILELAKSAEQIQRRTNRIMEQWNTLKMRGNPNLRRYDNELIRVLEKARATPSCSDVSDMRRILQQMLAIHQAAESAIELRIRELTERFVKIAAEHREIEENIKRLAEIPRAFSGRGIDEDDIGQRIASFLAGHNPPSCPRASLDPLGIETLESCESIYAEISKALEREQGEVLSKFDQQSIAKIVGPKDALRQKSRAISVHMARATCPGQSGSPAKGIQLSAKLGVLAAHLNLLPQGPSKDRLQEDLRQAISENNLAKKKILCTSLEFSISDAQKRENEMMKWIASLDRIEQEVASEQTDERVIEIIAKIRELRRTRTGESLEKLENHATAAVTLAQKARQGREKRKVILDSLREIGYKNDNELQTADAGGGSLVFRKDGDGEYGIQLNSDPSMDAIQMQVVRFADRTSVPEVEQVQRDIEKETAFCKEHSRLLKKIADRGYESTALKHLPPGTIPVRCINRTTSQQKRRLRQQDKSRSAES